MSRPIWRKISAFKCWPAPRACQCLTSPAHSNSRKACPRTSIWCDVACGVCRSSWLRQICLFRKLRALPGFRIKAIARAGSESRSASLRAATDGRCARADPHGNRSPVRALFESEGRAFRRVAGIFQRADKIFLTLALKFFLRCPEVCNARCDFLPLSSDCLLSFGHAHPFLIRVSRLLVVAIGARIGARRCRIVVANRVLPSQVHSERRWL
jgi:hypothetical protein